MYTVPMKFVPQWVQNNNKWVPEAVDIHCPFCGRYVTFALQNWSHDGQRNTMAAIATCPACHRQPRFWVVDPRNYGDTAGRESDALCMHPTPNLNRPPMPGIELVPGEIRRAYASSINVLNTGEWTATAVCCRRVLEGIVKNLLPPESKNKSLAQQLEELPSKVDLAKPLTTLAHGLRQGGNLGAHFDLSSEPDEATARMMVELLEYLMEYIYVTPGQVQELHAKIKELK